MRRAYISKGKPEGCESHRSVAELAEFVGVSERTIERWHKSGRIPPPHTVTQAGWKLWSKEQAVEILSEKLERKTYQ